MNVIVTGGTGFLGQALVKELSENGDNVIAIVRPDSCKINRIKGLRNVKIILSELSEDVVIPINDCDVFYHLAWEGARDDFEAQYKNVDLTLQCVRLASKYKCKKIICTGSQAEYGETTDYITEDTPTVPTTSYGSAKVAAYYLSRDLSRKLNIEHIWVRVFSVYGDNDNPNTLYSKLCFAMKNSENFEMNTDGKHIWNYLHEADAARALRKLGNTNVLEGIYNLASKESKPLQEYINNLKMKIESTSNINYSDVRSKINLNVKPDKLINAITEYEKMKFL